MATLIAMPTHTVLPGISPGTTPGTVLHTLGDGMILGTIPGTAPGMDQVTLGAGMILGTTHTIPVSTRGITQAGIRATIL